MKILATVLLLTPLALWAEGVSKLPSEVADLHLGMPIEDFYKARPALHDRLAKDPENHDLTKNQSILEKFEKPNHFDSAIYLFENKKLAGVMLYALQGKRDVAKERRNIFQDSAKLWGESAEKKLVAVEPKSKKPHRNVPKLSWITADAKVQLLSPEASRPSDPHAILTIISADAPQSLNVQYDDEKASESDRARAFKAAGLE